MSHRVRAKKAHPKSKHTRAAKPRHKDELKSSLLFMKKFFMPGFTIGSIWPSSKALSKATVKEIDFSRPGIIVELGAGTGPITQAVVDRLKPHTRFIAIERDHDFAQILRKRFANHPNVEIIQGDVRELDSILRKLNVDKVDYFVSGLPSPTLPIGVRRRMFASVRRYLNPSGVFSNITEFPLIYLRYYKSLFQDVDFQFVSLNMPPGGVYHCRMMR